MSNEPDRVFPFGKPQPVKKSPPSDDVVSVKAKPAKVVKEGDVDGSAKV
jgi:hypothetical protein